MDLTDGQVREIDNLVHKTVKAILRDRGRTDMIEDTLQTAWSQVMHFLPKYDPERGGLLSFLYPYIKFTAVHAARDYGGGYFLSERYWGEVREGGRELPKRVTVVSDHEGERGVRLDSLPEFAADPPEPHRAELEQLIARAQGLGKQAFARAWEHAEGHSFSDIGRREGVSKQAVEQSWKKTVEHLRRAV